MFGGKLNSSAPTFLGGGGRGGVDEDDLGALLAVVLGAAVGELELLDVLGGGEQLAAGGGVGVDQGTAVLALLGQEGLAVLCGEERKD